MIRYNLRCRKGHEFEAWFRSIADYDRQAADNAVACPACGDHKTEKALMAPSIGRAGKDKGRPTPEPQTPAPASQPGDAAASDKVQLAADPRQQALIQAMRELRKKIVEGADYVGDKFAEEARKIHFKEADPRGIYGEATRDEVAELIDDGVDFLPLPHVPDEAN